MVKKYFCYFKGKSFNNTFDILRLMEDNKINRNYCLFCKTPNFIGEYLDIREMGNVHKTLFIISVDYIKKYDGIKRNGIYKAHISKDTEKKINALINIGDYSFVDEYLIPQNKEF